MNISGHRSDTKLPTYYGTQETYLNHRMLKDFKPSFERLLFFGSCPFSIASLSALLNANLARKIEVVTPPDNPSRINSPKVPLKSFAESYGLTVHDAPPRTLKHWEIPDNSGRSPFDIGVVVSFGYFIPRRIIDSFRVPPVNVHPSLLPQYRGAAPIHQTIINGDRETGISIIELHPTRFDSGRILKQQRLNIPITDPDYLTLESYLAEIGGRELVTVLRDYDRYQQQARPQQPSNSTDSILIKKAPKLTRQGGDHLIRWPGSGDAWQIYRRYRAVKHQFHLQCDWPLANAPSVRLVTLRSPAEVCAELYLLHSSGRLGTADRKPGDYYFNPITNTLFIRTEFKFNSGTSNVAKNLIMEDQEDDELKIASDLGHAWLAVKKVQLDGRDPINVSSFISRMI